MEIQTLLAKRLIADDPTRSLDHALALLMEQTSATMSGIFAVRGRPELLAGRGLDQRGLDRVREVWKDEGAALRASRPACRGTWCVWPLETERPSLIYLANEDAPLQIASVRSAIEGLGDFLTTGIRLEATSTAPPTIDSYLETAPEDEIEKRRLVLLLGRHEWNIARVSRLMGVTRRTIYNRIARLGIERLRVRKALERAKAEGV